MNRNEVSLRQVHHAGNSSVQMDCAGLRRGFVGRDFADGCQQPAVQRGRDGKLVYATDERGNRIPDFSNCGYAGARSRHSRPCRRPVIVDRATATTPPGSKPRSTRSPSLPLDKMASAAPSRLRPGHLKSPANCESRTPASSCAERGRRGRHNARRHRYGSPHADPSVRRRRSRFRSETIGRGRRVRAGRRPPTAIDPPFAGYRVGDQVMVTRPSTGEWIKAIGADAFGVGWRPGSRDIRWDRIVTAIDGDTITLDAPITTAIEKRFGGATVAAYDWPGRIENVGVEDLRLVSQPTTDKPHDEEHAWFGVTMENVQNAWVRRVEFRASPAARSRSGRATKWVTVEDCISLAPISELGGYRRHTFFTQGQLTLFLRCWSEQGRHDFAVGHCAAGPNAFVNCRTRDVARRQRADRKLGVRRAVRQRADRRRRRSTSRTAGSIRRAPAGRPPTACSGNARRRRCACFRPPTANNWAIGVWAGFAGDGTFEAPQRFRPADEPVSGTTARARRRRGRQPRRPDPRSSRSARRIRRSQKRRSSSRESHEPARRVDRRDSRANCRSTRDGQASSELRRRADSQLDTRPRSRIAQAAHASKTAGSSSTASVVTGGRFDHRLGGAATCGRTKRRSSARASRGSCPAASGTGFTDDLAQVADDMVAATASPSSIITTACGTTGGATTTRWSGRRTATSPPPFYEQPFARTGDAARHRLGRAQQVRPHEVQSVVLAAAARLRPAVRRARPRAGPSELLPAQHPRSGRPLGRLALAAGEQRQRHRLPRAAALHRRQADLHGRQRSTT